MGKLTIGIFKQDLAVDSTGSDQGWIQSVDLVGCHDDLDITSVVETIQLIQQLQHSSLNFSFTA